MREWEGLFPDRGGHPSNQPGLLFFGNSPSPSSSQAPVQVPISPQGVDVCSCYRPFFFFCPTQEHQALLVKVREGDMALEELRIKNADCQAEREK